MERGFIFSIDAILASTALLLMLLIVFIHTQSMISENAEAIGNNEKELLALSLSEAIVKNRNTENPYKGAAYFDAEKQRVQPNLIDPNLLSQIKPEKLGKYRLEALYERDEKSKEFLFGSITENCTAIERFVAIKEFTARKTIIGVVVCG